QGRKRQGVCGHPSRVPNKDDKHRLLCSKSDDDGGNPEVQKEKENCADHRCEKRNEGVRGLASDDLVCQTGDYCREDEPRVIRGGSVGNAPEENTKLVRASAIALTLTSPVIKSFRDLDIDSLYVGFRGRL